VKRTACHFRALVLSGGALFVTACTANAPSAMDAQGYGATRINLLWWVMLGLGTLTFIGVVVLLLMALFRRRPADDQELQADPEHVQRFGRRMIGGGGVILPVVVLIPLLGFTAYIGATLNPPQQPTMTIEVIGHQFWWELRYPDHGFVTANELVIPAGQPVELRLSTSDVIHSFWVPQLNGKVDLIPGQSNTIVIQADAPGEYRGQCAEFCGRQHALMALLVIAEPADRFAAWAEAQQLPAGELNDPLLRQGQQIFLGSACVYCHVIRGHTGDDQTQSVGPDLTHLASRRTLAAVTLPNTRGNLGGWLIDPQAIKPGNHMPGTDLDSASLQALLAYLESLE
jgi:cytochrome c oxidase subunit II